MECFNCGKQTKNPKFCSRSCGATVNGKLFPKRKRKIWYCIKCGKECKYTRKYCSIECNPQYRDWNNISIVEATSKRIYQRHSRLRTLARKFYYKHINSMPICLVCGYSLHIEICHIKAVNLFDDNTLISEVNAEENLVALCPNHHWEFDNNLIKIGQTGFEPVTSTLEE